MHISYSELKTWAECPWKRKLSYQDRVKKFIGNEELNNIDTLKKLRL